jgi:hypothetical protein
MSCTTIKIILDNFVFEELKRLATMFNFFFLLNPMKPELNPSSQRCLTRLFTGDFASWTLNVVNICVKTQPMQQLFIQFINYVW